MTVKWTFAALLWLSIGAVAAAQGRDFCIAPPHDRLCADFPNDQPDFSRFFEYRVINGPAQEPFDFFAWQAFVALNWSDVAPGEPTPSNWRGWLRKRDVFAQPAGPCDLQSTSQATVIADLEQPDGNTLIDTRGNFILYETRLNGVSADFIRSNRLTTPKGRAALSSSIAFPQGVDAAHPASVLTKTAWRVLPADGNGYITADGLVPIPAERSLDGVAHCLPVRLGLVGMHIVVKVISGHGDKWIWATLERRDTVPTAGNARRINSIYSNDLFPNGCTAPTQVDRAFLLFNQDCPDCPTNQPPPAALWAAEPPFARDDLGLPLTPSRIVRCWRIFGPTERTNQRWQARLRGTVLENYQVVSTQWRGANPDPIFENGELPRYLSNSTMETYLQTDPMGSCLTCHASARTAEGAFSDFTFLMR